MIDRIEELLSAMAAEDEEEQEDVLVLPTAEETVPASPRGDGGEAGEVGTGDRSGGRTAGEIALERPGMIAGETDDGGTGDRSGGRTAGEIALERSGLAAGERSTAAESAQAAGGLWKDGPVWTVRSGPPEMDGARRAAQDITQGSTPGDAGRSGPARAGLEQAGLKRLYRQTVQGLRPTALSLPPEQAGKTAWAQEPGSAASLAVDELDRAVRRDSRRYDGGMSIY